MGHVDKHVRTSRSTSPTATSTPFLPPPFGLTVSLSCRLHATMNVAHVARGMALMMELKAMALTMLRSWSRWFSSLRASSAR